jgi:hypothetical protein
MKCGHDTTLQDTLYLQCNAICMLFMLKVSIVFASMVLRAHISFAYIHMFAHIYMYKDSNVLFCDVEPWCQEAAERFDGK